MTPDLEVVDKNLFVELRIVTEKVEPLITIQ